MRISFKRLFAAILPLTGLLLTAPLATTAHAERDPRWYRHHHRYDYRYRNWHRYGNQNPYYYNRRWYGAPERYSYYRPDPYWYGYKRHHHDD
jgi:hypothetical protein